MEIHDDKEEYANDLFKVVREGKNIFIHGNMSEEAHKAYVKRLTDNRPEITEELNALVEKVAASINWKNRTY